MSDLVRFRVARAPQRRIPDPVSLVEVGPSKLIDAWLESQDLAQLAAGYLGDLGVTARTAQLELDDGDLARPFARLRALDRELARAGNRPTVKEVTDTVRDLFDQAPRELVQDPWWLQLRGLISEALVAATVVTVTPDLRSDLTRLLLVAGLVEALSLANSPVKQPGDVYWALRWRTVVLPEALLVRLREARPVLARRPGFADLYVVRDEWNRYEPGEIAHIESVLPGEPTSTPPSSPASRCHARSRGSRSAPGKPERSGP
jgi:hypothetical protein